MYELLREQQKRSTQALSKLQEIIPTKRAIQMLPLLGFERAQTNNGRCRRMVDFMRNTLRSRRRNWPGKSRHRRCSSIGFFVYLVEAVISIATIHLSFCEAKTGIGAIGVIDAECRKYRRWDAGTQPGGMGVQTVSWRDGDMFSGELLSINSKQPPRLKT